VAEEEIADASAGEVSLVALGAEALDDGFGGDLGRGLGHVSTIENVMRGDSSSGLILGIESSCDETAAAVVRRGVHTLSNVVASQIATHSPYGGVVPELASREHLRNIVPVVKEALHKATVGFGDLDAIAVTEGPGLAGALLVGISYAKSLAFALGKPLIAVNHLEGHIHAVLLQRAELAADRGEDPLEFPALALVVSGGHTHLYLARRRGEGWVYRNVGRTVDDAAGEAFDKVAKLLGLGYPGGPWIDALAPHGDAGAVPFSFAQVKAKAHREGSAELVAAKTLFSFSGIKTAVLRYTQVHAMAAGIEERRRRLAERPGIRAAEALEFFDRQTLDLIASFQHAVVGDLLRKTFRAAEGFGAASLLVSGGVAANRELRVRFTAEAAERGIPIAFPSLALSTDNAAMIAAAAWPKFATGEFAAETVTADPGLALGG
jgi:N6-L-threonylcarbamoyladenine synthase